MLVIPANTTVSGGGGAYTLTRSLRFRRGATPSLSRTFTTSATWTFSAWVKRGGLGAISPLFGDGVKFLAGDTLTAGSLTTSSVYRDPAAWLHIHVSNGGLFVNGVSVGSVTTSALTNPKIGSNGTNYFDGCLAEVYFVDGVSVAVGNFGSIDSTTGVWQPKAYTGSYGTNGFYLPFTDNSALTTSSNVGLGKDFSGNGNFFATTGIGLTAGATYDSFTDVPTLTSATAANFAVLNPLDKVLDTGAVPALQNANLTVYSDATISNFRTWYATINLPSGYWYFEMYLHAVGAADTASQCIHFGGQRFYQNGTKTGGVAYGSAWAATNTIGVAISPTGCWVHINGTWQGSATMAEVIANTLTNSIGAPTFPLDILVGDFSATSDSYYHASFNFGQQPWTYTPPTGFLSLNTFNLPDPVIKKPNTQFDATLYTGNGSTQTVVNAGAFQPDLVWVKDRTSALDHKLTDSVRGVQKAISSNLSAAEVTDTTGLTAFNANGFSVGANTSYNTNTDNMVSWQWKKGATQGFDIVSYTGNAGSQTFAHSLGVAPAMMICKSRGSAADWLVYHKSLGGTQGLRLNTTAALETSSSFWTNVTPGSGTFSVGAYHIASTYIAYLWSEIPGFSAFGKYTGNGSTDGPFVYCGFRPRFVMAKRTDATGGWEIIDTARDSSNVSSRILEPSSASAETASGTFLVDMTANGFKVRGADSWLNASAGTYIFAAFAENPFKYSLAR